MLVSRLPDRRALARLVRAALRHEVAQVALASNGPQRADAHTLDLHVPGEPPLALLAEPAGGPIDGLYPLRLRPLYRAQAAQLYAILEAEKMTLDGPRTPVPPPPAPSAPDPVTTRFEARPRPRLVKRAAQPPPPPAESDAAPIMRAMAGAPPPVVVEPPMYTPPSAPSITIDEAAPQRDEEEDDAGPNADDASLSVSVVFEPEDMPAAIGAMRAQMLSSSELETELEPHEDAADEDVEVSLPADLEEPSLSVSVVFEPDALSPELLASIPSPLGEAMRAPSPAPPPAEEETADPEDPPPSSAAEMTITEQVPTDDASFFDDALMNFPAPDLDLELTGEAEGDAAEEDPPVDLADAPTPTPATSSAEMLDVDADDVELVEREEEGLVVVPPPPDDLVDERPRPPQHRFDDDDEATIVRVPIQPAPVAARAPTVEEDPHATQAPPAGSEEDEDLPAVVGRKKSTRRKPRDKKPSERIVVPADEEATATYQKAVRPDPSDAPPPSSSRARADDPAIGRRIAEGKYAIESLIGAGAAGAVYRATHRELRRTVAIKLLHPHYQQDPTFMTSFRGEALAASQLDHPNVMRVLDFGQEPDGLVYIVMEYLSGRTLQSLLDEERRLPTERAVEVMVQVCAALSVAHDHGIIHRDIKPDNIMLVPSRNDEGTTFELVKVCDFGIAALQNPRAEDAELATTEQVIAGTPEYMSPEQARGTEVDARSDVYACGICLYELVTGRPPFIGDTAADILIKQLEELPKPPSQMIKGLDPILEEVILRAIQKEPSKRHQSAREMRVEMKELIDPGEGYDKDDEDELSIVENLPVLDDPASGFPGFFIAFASAILRFGRFERGHNEANQAMKELQRGLRIALRGRTELTFARRDAHKVIGFVVMSGTAEIVDLRRLLGSQLMGSFGEPFIAEIVKKGVAAITLREGIPDPELHYLVEMLLGPFSGEDLRKELTSKPLRHVSVIFVTDVIGRDRKLSWKVGLCASRLARDLRALCNVRGISLKKMRETRDELVGGVARLLTKGEEVKQFIFNHDLVDDAVANLRGFASFQVAPIIVERVLHESCAETATILLSEYDMPDADREALTPTLRVFAQRLVTERSPRSDAAVAALFGHGIIVEDEIPRDLLESIRAQTLADALVREPSQFLLSLDLLADPAEYVEELSVLETAMATLARRAEAVALLAVMSTLARHAKSHGRPGPRENAALRAMKSMFDRQRLLPIANTLLVGPVHQREAARQLVAIAGHVGAQALYAARLGTLDPTARGIFVQVFKQMGPAAWGVLGQELPQLELRDDAELALVEDLLHTLPERADPALGEVVMKFLPHPLLRATALTAIGPLLGDRARKPLVEALEYAEEPARILALGELRKLQAIDEYVFSVIERFLTMKGIAGEELRAAAAAAVADVSAPLRMRAVQLLAKAVEGKRGFLASLRGNDNSDESVVVMEAMGRALLHLDRNEGTKAVKSRISRSEGVLKQRLTAMLQS